MSASVWAYLSKEYSDAYTTVKGISGASPAPHGKDGTPQPGERTCTPNEMRSPDKVVCPLTKTRIRTPNSLTLDVLDVQLSLNAISHVVLADIFVNGHVHAASGAELLEVFRVVELTLELRNRH